jgi:integrase
MAKTSKKTGIANPLPGTIYSRNGRYWYKVQLPGEAKPIARPLVPTGSKFATSDYSAAVEIAKNIFQQAIYNNQTTIATTAISNIAALTAAYLDYVRGYYVSEQGKLTREIVDIRYSLKPLTDLFAALPVNEFGPLKLIEVRDSMIRSNLSRNLINQRVGRIKRMFKWAVSRQLVSPIIYQGLITVEGLKRGRCAARETEKRRPVEERHVYAILPYTTPVVAAMIELQLLTGMRPGELVILRPCDIDRSGKVWHYTPAHHKTQYRGDERIISIGPRGQDILTPFLLRPAETYCFSPAESEKQRREKMSLERITPLCCGNVPGSNVKEDPKKTPGNEYDSMSYGKAVRHAITAANKAIKEAAKEKEIEKPDLIPVWTPYQLRHTAATKVRREMGYETAGATLGHTNMSATAIYAERNQGLADEAARRLG